MKKIALFSLFVFAAGYAYAEEAKPAAAAEAKPAAVAAEAKPAAVAAEAKPAADAWKTKTFTAEELKKFNGKNGAPAYAAVNGIVYDLSSHKSWKTGLHMGHQAGMDLTKAIEKAPKAMHGEKNFEKYPKVGVMAKDAPVAEKKAEVKAEAKKEEKKDEKTAAKK